MPSLAMRGRLVVAVGLAAAAATGARAFCAGGFGHRGLHAAARGAVSGGTSTANQAAPSVSVTALLCGTALAACASRGVVRITRRATRARAAAPADEISGDAELGRRALLAGAGACTALGWASQALAEEADVDVPDRVNQNPFELIEVDPDKEKDMKKAFRMNKKYREDTFQVIKHMKLSAALDKGTPEMERWNKQVKEEMGDWLALYRRQDQMVGRQSYYTMYSGINTLASHFTSYGTKFPFPTKRRARLYELMQISERYLEKGK